MSGVFIETSADVGAVAWINGVEMIHRGGGRWTTPPFLSTDLIGQDTGYEPRSIFIPNKVPKRGRPLSVGVLKSGWR